MGRLAHCALAVVILSLAGCAGGSARDSSAQLPYFREYPVALQVLAAAAAEAVAASYLGLELDTRQSRPTRLITVPQPLPIKAARRLARPGRPGLRGRPLAARLHVELTLAPSRSRKDASRITIQPVFRVYISRWGDQRQWIQWQSNATVELELLAGIGAQLGMEGEE